MSLFAVIKVQLMSPDCWVENMECLKTFNTRNEAQDYVSTLLEERKEIDLARSNYIKSYVADKVVVPDLLFKEWIEYKENLFGYYDNSCTPNNFKSWVEECLHKGYGIKFEKLDDYIQMPKSSNPGYNDLHVVEIGG